MSKSTRVNFSICQGWTIRIVKTAWEDRKPYMALISFNRSITLNLVLTQEIEIKKPCKLGNQDCRT